ncbi:DUF748 domain-containing protein [Pelotalea chapellei]|uniref:DUF748 domain-containing protein n=1 Tax=Pelotalea chapellei TaxID=44671 RepID=A0ABS5U9R5_9BACT|nr:DUF748 domain-containing protein [Pelotalea chapellei]MBT1072383.1 DUF748 domain-containing protein [Pelotalea chapellei]
MNDSQKKPRPTGILHSRVLRWVGGTLLVLLLLLFIASFFLDEPLRKMTEQKANKALKGYSVRIPKLHLQLIGLTLTLKELSIIQEAHPDPPVAVVPLVKLSVHWREIFSGKLVAEMLLDRPRLHVNLQQLRTEAKSEVKLKERGWQEALIAVYPLKINRIEINSGAITYIDQDPARPLVLSALNFTANNIRNIHLPDKVYPSEFHLDTAIFGSGHGRIDGRANFLGEPHLGAKATFAVEKIPVDYFKPMLARSNLVIKNGLLTVSGNTEYAPTIKKAHVENLEIRGVEVEYIYSSGTAAAQKKDVAKAGKAAKKASNKPDILLRIDKLRVLESTFGMKNADSDPNYRAFISDTNLTLTNLSNQFVEGPAEAHLQGKFMGNGPTDARATFRAEKSGPDLDLAVKINDTQLTSMNNLLRAYGKFDVTAGLFSFVSELHVKNSQVSGYIKPFFKDMKVYDTRQDKEKSLFKKMYEMLVGGVSQLLQNQPRDEVATKTDISGKLDKPQISTWQTVVALVRNAFFKAILPSFEREAGKTGKE